MTVEKCMGQSLVYERASARVSNIINDLYARKRMDAIIDAANDEKPDESINLVIKCLKTLQSNLSKESDRLWLKAETKAEFYDSAFEKLSNAIIVKAVEDYEVAISGYGNEHEKTLIERFAERCDNGEIPYTKIEVANLLKMVRTAKDKFSVVAKTYGKEIIAETKAKKAEHKDITDMKHKCPLCGGSLYSFSQLGVHRICCTNCYLSEIVKVDKKKSL